MCVFERMRSSEKNCAEVALTDGELVVPNVRTVFNFKILNNTRNLEVFIRKLLAVRPNLLTVGSNNL